MHASKGTDYNYLIKTVTTCRHFLFIGTQQSVLIEMRSELATTHYFYY